MSSSAVASKIETLEGAKVFVLGDVRVTVLPPTEVEEKAVADFTAQSRRRLHYSWPRDRICVRWVRHNLTNYDHLVRGLTSQSVFEQISRRVYAAIAQAYPWLAEECAQQHMYRASKGRYGSIDINVVRSLPGIAEEEDENEYVPEFFQRQHSLAAERYIYLPPFLPRNEIKLRRFGGQLSMNDRWWEWEAELGVKSTAGRPALKRSKL